MDSITLVESARDGGRALLERLDRRGLPITAAFWITLPETGRWRLVFAWDGVGAIDPRPQFNIILDELNSLSPPPPFSLNDVYLVSPSDPLVRAISRIIRTPPAPGIAGMSVERSVFNGVLVESLYIYRMCP